MSISVRFNKEKVNTGKKCFKKANTEVIYRENITLFDKTETPKQENKLTMNTEIVKNWKEFQKVKKSIKLNAN